MSINSNVLNSNAKHLSDHDPPPKGQIIWNLIKTKRFILLSPGAVLQRRKITCNKIYLQKIYDDIVIRLV
jgi:hypothetical protein